MAFRLTQAIAARKTLPLSATPCDNQGVPRILAALATPLLLACTGGAGGPPTPTVDLEALARELAPGVPLTLGDLPAGWDESMADLVGQVELSPECDIFDLDVAFPGAAATAQSPDYEGMLNEQLITYAAVFHSADDARATVQATRGTVERCRDEFTSEGRRLAEAELEALGVDLGLFADITVEIFERENAPTLGDVSAAYVLQVTVSLPGDDQRFTIDVRAFAEGRVAGAIICAKFGADDPAAALDLAQRLLGKAAVAEAQLPAP